DKDARALAKVVWDAHRTPTALGPKVTLAVVNRVDTARNVFDGVGALAERAGEEVELRLLHSRFRGIERQAWTREFLSREHCEAAGANRIIVATQVIEAGVDF